MLGCEKMFFKKKKYVEMPLYYWEEKSYMMVIPKDKKDLLLKDSFDRIKAIAGLEVIENTYSIQDNTMHLKIKYDDDFFEVGIFAGAVSVPKHYLNKDYMFLEEEKEAILTAKDAITVFMEFNEKAAKCYQLQLRLCYALVPNMYGIIDESAEKILPARWVYMCCQTKTLPNPKNLFSVQAVVEDNGEVWLHTHGLTRCGINELEILRSDSKNYQNHYNLILSYATYLLDRRLKKETPMGGAYIGMLINRQPIVVTSTSWTKALTYYKHLDLGGIKDRKLGHNSKTNVIFLYKDETDQEKNILNKITIFDNLWGDNPIFFVSDAETERMKKMAQERFDYVKEAFKDKDNSVSIKIGMPIMNKKDKFEHIWFDLLEIGDKKFKARLTQEPYDNINMKINDEAWFTINDVTDWIIYTKKNRISPDEVYILENK